MTKGKPRNLAASVRQRLMNLAREKNEDFQLVLTRYALERLLYRLSQSEHRDVFVLKGAMLFQLWGDRSCIAGRMNNGGRIVFESLRFTLSQASWRSVCSRQSRIRPW